MHTDHVRFDKAGNTQIRLNDQWEPLCLSEQVCQSILPNEPVKRLFICGLGLGELITAALNHHAAQTIVAWERDPYLMRLTLQRTDIADALRTGRVQLALGPDLIDYMGSCDHVIAHPSLVFAYKREAELARSHPSRDAWALLCHGGLFVDDLADALEREGYRCLPWDIDRLSQHELAQYVSTVRPKLVAAINYRNGLAEACESFGLPLICWEIDPAIDVVQPCASPHPNAHIFTWRHAHLDTYQQAGFPNTYFTPLASSTFRRYPKELTEAERATYDAPLCFVGASCTRQIPQFRSMLMDDLGPYLAKYHPELRADDTIHALLQAQQHDFSSFVLPQLIAEHLPMFTDYVRQQGKTYDPSIVLGEIAAAEKRLTYLANLAQFGLDVWGDAGWKRLEPYGVNYRGKAGHLVELTTIYNAAQIHIDIGRIYQSDIVTMRVFDVLACGGFLLAEYSEGLADLFELGHELVCYRTLDELIDRVNYYQRNPELARQIAARGRARVEADHTIAQRVHEMLLKTGCSLHSGRPILVG